MYKLGFEKFNDFSVTFFSSFQFKIRHAPQVEYLIKLNTACVSTKKMVKRKNWPQSFDYYLVCYTLFCRSSSCSINTISHICHTCIFVQSACIFYLLDRLVLFCRESVKKICMRTISLSTTTSSLSSSTDSKSNASLLFFTVHMKWFRFEGKTVHKHTLWRHSSLILFRAKRIWNLSMLSLSRWIVWNFVFYWSSRSTNTYFKHAVCSIVECIFLLSMVH